MEGPAPVELTGVMGRGPSMGQGKAWDSAAPGRGPGPSKWAATWPFCA